MKLDPLILIPMALSLLLMLPGCDANVEGDEAGECGDGVDNDQDGPTDCDDSGCATASACAGDDDDGEICGDGVDNDGDGVVDEGEDADADGFWTCGTGNLDCDDTNAAIHPAAGESCDGIDGNCDGVLPDDEVDADGDGCMVCEGDLDDADPDVCMGGDDDDSSDDDDSGDDDDAAVIDFSEFDGFEFINIDWSEATAPEGAWDCIEYEGWAVTGQESTVDDQNLCAVCDHIWTLTYTRTPGLEECLEFTSLPADTGFQRNLGFEVLNYVDFTVWGNFNDPAGLMEPVGEGALREDETYTWGGGADYRFDGAGEFEFFFSGEGSF